jgi:hypothetical protein
VHQPLDNEYATVVLEGMGRVDVCDAKISSGEVCFASADTLIAGSSYTNLVRAHVPVGISLEAFRQTAWACAKFTCADTTHLFHNNVKPTDMVFRPSTIDEMVIMTEVSFTQTTFADMSIQWKSIQEQTDESRIYYQQPKLGPEEVYCVLPLNPGGLSYASMPFREITKGAEFRLKVYTFKYYIGGVKAATLDTFPCVEDINMLGTTTIKLSILWQSQIMTRYNTYRNTPSLTPRICNTDGPEGLVPNASTIFDTLIPRNSTTNNEVGDTTGMKATQNVADRIQHVVSVLHSKIQARATVCETQCAVVEDDIQGYVKITDRYTSSRDPFFRAGIGGRVRGRSTTDASTPTKTGINASTATPTQTAMNDRSNTST